MKAAYRASTARIVAAILMATALLLAQSLGLKHRIAHAGLQQAHVNVDVTGDSADDKDASHSCAAFDAATVGHSLPIAPFIAQLVTSAQVLALWAAFISWDAPPAVCFSSRAPPSA